MKKAIEYTGYTSKAGNVGLYKITAKFTTKEGVKRVKLESMGKNPVTFWADESKLCAPPMPTERRPGEQTRRCWECGGEFTWRECIAAGGEWSENYCGC